MLNAGNNGEIWSAVQAVVASIVVLIYALYRDNRTHKRIDATDAWISKVEEHNSKAIGRVEKAQKEHTEMILRDYPTINGMNKALEPISEKMDDLKRTIIDIKSELDSEQKQKIINQEREIALLKSKLLEKDKP